MEPIPPTEEVLGELIHQGDSELVASLLMMGRIAKQTVPECVELSLALLEDGLTFTLVASSEEISALNAIQYLDGGPCVTAAHEDHLIEVDRGDIFDEGRWLMYAQATAAAGVASSLTLPILGGGRVVGTVNLYAATADAFEGHHQDLAALSRVLPRTWSPTPTSPSALASKPPRHPPAWLMSTTSTLRSASSLPARVWTSQRRENVCDRQPHEQGSPKLKPPAPSGQPSTRHHEDSASADRSTGPPAEPGRSHRRSVLHAPERGHRL